MTIYVMRHGETFWNSQELVCGSSDIQLNSVGREQAKEMARVLERYPIEKIYSSPLQRAYETAKIIGEKIECPILTDVRLVEQDYGRFEGQKRLESEFMESKGQFAYTDAQNESLLHVAQRVYNFIDELKQRKEKNVLIVSHGCVCRIIYSYFNSMTNDEFVKFRLSNCALVTFEI